MALVQDLINGSEWEPQASIPPNARGKRRPAFDVTRTVPEDDVDCPAIDHPAL
jgi:hypothetical protein